MKSWRKLCIMAGAAVAFIPLSALPAGGASTGINVDVVAVGTTEEQGPCALGGGPPFSDWSLNGVAVGSSPSVATISINDGGSVGYGVGFTLKDINGNSLTGSANSFSASSFTGTVTSATGTYASLVGAPVQMNFSVTPIQTPVPGVNLGENNCTFTTLSPSALVGTIEVP